jgi:hypothetical protein
VTTPTIGLKPEDKAEAILQQWLEPKGVRFESEETEASYRARLGRVMEALRLGVPDRVPYAPTFGLFPAFYGGITVEDAMYDYARAHRAWKKTILDMKPDLYVNSSGVYPGRALEALDYKLMRWPRHGLGSNDTFQFIDGEYMQADEYDELLSDPSDFMIRKYYPRVFGALQPLERLLPLHNGIWMVMLGLVASFGGAGIGEALQALAAAGKEMSAWFEYLHSFDREIQSLGYPCMGASMTFAPFDLIGDTLRGTRGIMLDMYRRPDALLAAIDKVTPFAIQMGVSGAVQAGNPMVWIYLHKGAGGLMSDPQFQTFYWPSLRAVILGLLDEGLTPCVYTEGDYTPRLQAIANVPRGRVLYHFETVEIHNAKEVLGDIACISGTVPLAVLATGTIQDVRESCREIIDVLGKDGGFILDSSAAINEARAENVKAMGDFCREYGVYR